MSKLDLLERMMIYLCYIGGVGSIIYGVLSSSLAFTSAGVLVLVLVTLHRNEAGERRA